MSSITERIRSSIGVKVGVITILVLILLIPTGMILALIYERDNNRMGAIEEVSSKWGNSQILAGPVLTVPYIKVHKYKDGSTYTTTHYAYFLPDVLKADSVVTPEVRHRGIYEVVLYRSAVKLSGNFDLKALNTYGIRRDRVLWKRVTLSVGISDLRGVRGAVQFLWNGDPLAVDPGMDNDGLITRGISAHASLKPDAATYSFDMAMNLNGSDKLMFVPFGKETTASMTSPWHAPSFMGEFLPKQHHVTEKGFSAQWNVQYLNREYPQHWKDKKIEYAKSAFGVALLYPADGYQKTMRTAKYAILFIGMAFLAFFLIEVLGGLRIHPIQYLLVGVALLVFYTLLLSLTEHIGFGIAYGLSSVAMVAVISGYSASILHSRKLGALMASVVGVLYGYMYVVLQLEDYALMFGSIGLFLVVALTMYMTRKVDWYTLGGKRPEESEGGLEHEMGLENDVI